MHFLVSISSIFYKTLKGTESVILSDPSYEKVTADS